jgi:hypothetical protein
MAKLAAADVATNDHISHETSLTFNRFDFEILLYNYFKA